MSLRVCQSERSKEWSCGREFLSGARGRAKLPRHARRSVMSIHASQTCVYTALNHSPTPLDPDSRMGLEDFEKELAASKAKEDRKKRDRSRSRDRHHRSSKHHSSRHHRDDRDRDGHHRDKRSRRNRATSEERSQRKRTERGRDDKYDDPLRRKHKDRRSPSPSSEDEDRMTRKRKSRHYEEDESSGDDPPQERDYAPHADELLDEQLEEAAGANVQRDDWMQAPSTMDVDYVQRKKREDKTTYVAASAEKQHTLKIHKAELNHHHLADLDKDKVSTTEEPAQREVDYTFGDSGSQWRMTKLKGIYRDAEETGRTAEEVALQKYGDLRDFDESREEEIELDRRNMYGKNYVGKEKPSGELHEERRLKAGVHRPSQEDHEMEHLPQGQTVIDPQPTTNTVALSQTELNKLKAQMMKAKLKKSPDVARLEAEYNAAIAGSAGSTDRDVVVLNAMDNRMLAGGRQGEVISIENKRGVERGLVKDNEDMSIEDMVRQERRTKGQNEGLLLAEKIGKDVKFDVSATKPMCITPALSQDRTTSITWTRTLLDLLLALPNHPSTSATLRFRTTRRLTASSTHAHYATTKTSRLPSLQLPLSSLWVRALSSHCPPSPRSATAARS